VSKPFLFRFAQPCLSPGRTMPEPEYYYDEELSMVRWFGSPEHPLAIELTDKPGPPTKKADIEKGDDDKDKRMWK
jgi:hypothetical protein